MASSFNFENHIKRFIESMRGVQRVLYIGTDIDMKKYPVLAGLSWRCIYTASQDENLGEAFSLTNDRQIKSICSKDAYDKAGNKLARNNPLLIYESTLMGILHRIQNPMIWMQKLNGMRTVVRCWIP